MAKPRVLAVEDDAEIRGLVAYSLAKEGYEVVEAETGERGLELAAASPPDLMLLDVMLPGIDGLEVLRRLKRNPGTASVPVILLTARSEEADVVSGLELGADDYVTKPFGVKVLVARIRAALRRRAELPAERERGLLSSNGIVLDEERHEARVDGNDVSLTAGEFAALALLMRDPGHVYTRPRIIEELKGPDYPVTDRSVDVMILSLRKKLGDKGDAIETVRGVGYRMRRG